MTASFRLRPILLLSALLVLPACGYTAADDDDVEPRTGEIAGVLVKDNDKSDPNATIQLFASGGTTALSSVTGIDSDGRFGLFPPESGTYNVVGIIGDLDKAIRQNITFNMGDALNIGTLKAQRVAGLAVRVTVPAGYAAEGVLIEVLGYNATAITVTEGLGAIETGIPAGTYSVRFSKGGLATQTIEQVVLTAGQVTTMTDVAMAAE